MGFLQMGTGISRKEPFDTFVNRKEVKAAVDDTEKKVNVTDLIGMEDATLF